MMLDNSTTSAAVAEPVIKRYAPPNQRTRSLNRRKSAEKNQSVTLRNIPAAEHGETGSSSLLNENTHPVLIALEGCSHSAASHFLNERWAAAMNFYNDTTIDLSERPVMYSGSSPSAWGHFRLPHQLMSQANSAGDSSGLRMDFLAELRHAMAKANTGSDY
ncbi:hypothetical protein HS088_TW06G00372 [Tripterygium wilfordii]|uniref:Uncharacterized protein n=1 Tax=Tripterygium wilfordii TaxID=458696 RepID=A0A7J7DIL3_TRIWF|nr:uncharacterized protein LOC119999773 [Tripterygium wilfordii]KAF5746205.1 hypothetical protein HS088_TW06G00372 [Tripterygium wilfordii]